MKHCCVDYCTNPVAIKKVGLCKTCYHAMYYWTRMRKTPTDILNYRKKLMVRSARMRLLQPGVSTFARRRAG